MGMSLLIAVDAMRASGTDNLWLSAYLPSRLQSGLKYPHQAKPVGSVKDEFGFWIVHADLWPHKTTLQPLPR